MTVTMTPIDQDIATVSRRTIVQYAGIVLRMVVALL